MGESYCRRFMKRPVAECLCSSLISGAQTVWLFLERLTCDFDGMESKIHSFIDKGFPHEHSQFSPNSMCLINH